MKAIELKEVIVEWARRGAAKFKGRHGRMCNGCAFRKGSEANNEEHNVEAAAQCLMGNGKFHCHSHGEDGKLKDAGKPCAGFMYADELMNK